MNVDLKQDDRIWNQSVKSGCWKCVTFKAMHRHRRGRGSEFRTEPEIFLGLSFSSVTVAFPFITVSFKNLFKSKTFYIKFAKKIIRLTEKCEIKWLQIQHFPKIVNLKCRQIWAPQNREINVPRNFMSLGTHFSTIIMGYFEMYCQIIRASINQ